MAARQQIDCFQFRKISFASYAPRANVFPSLLYLQFDNGVLEVTNLFHQVPPYTLSHITSRVPLSHDNGCSQIKNWLCRILSVAEHNVHLGEGIKPPEVRLH